MKREMGIALLGALLGFMLGHFIALAETTWDPRLDELGVTLQPANDCSNGCWRLITARYEDVDESGLNHNVYSRLYSEAGDMVTGAPWHVAWPDGDIAIYSKAPPEWADFPIFACYSPARGPGPYHAYAGDDPSMSDVIRGIGLPQCQHVNYRLEWQWQATDDPCPGCTPRAYLPLASGP